MKKILLAAILLIGALLGLTSCQRQADYPYTEAGSQFLYGEYRYFKNDAHLLAYQSLGGEEQLVCPDPLCTHDSFECPSFLWSRGDIAVVEEDGAPVVYYTDEYRDFDADTREFRLYRFDRKSGERTVLLRQDELISSFWLFQNQIYLDIQCTNYNEEGHMVGIGSNLFVMNADGSDFRQLTDYYENSVRIAGITEEEGERTIYWVNSEDRSLYASPADFSSMTKVVEGVPQFGNFIHDGWLYYTQTDGTKVNPLIVEAHPSDKNKQADGTVVIRQEKAVSSYWRLPLSDLTGEPELVIAGTDMPISSWQPLLIDGDRAWVILYEPVYLETIAATMTGDTGDRVTDSLGSHVQVDYIVSDSGSRIWEIDLATGARQIIETPGFDVKSLMGLQGGNLWVSGYVVDGDRIREKLAAEGVTSSSYTFTEVQILDIGK